MRYVPPFQGFGELGRRGTQRDGVRPRVALRSTLGYLIMPLWGERSGYGSVLIAHRRRPKLCWVIRDGVCPMVLCPNGAAGSRVHSTKPNGFMPQRGGGIAGSLNEAQWSYAPTGRKGIAQGKAKRRPGIGVPETTQALKGRNRRRVNQCAHVSPFQGFGELGRRPTQGDGVRPRVALRTQGGAALYPGLSP